MHGHRAALTAATQENVRSADAVVYKPLINIEHTCIYCNRILNSDRKDGRLFVILGLDILVSELCSEMDGLCPAQYLLYLLLLTPGIALPDFET